MGVEIERKFLLKDDGWKSAVTGSASITQAYLVRDAARSVRVRRRADAAFLTIKGPAENGATPEFEYAIPATDADALLALCLQGAIIKTRHIVPHGGHTWEIDVFHGENEGLVLAEIELSSIDEPFTRPAWLGDEVTGDGRYANAALSQKPYKDW